MLKPFIVAGAVIQCLALGLMIRFRGQSNSLGDLATMQVLKGLGLGLISFPTQNAVQMASKHERSSSLTGRR